jgi:hypothetical protein
VPDLSHNVTRCISLTLVTLCLLCHFCDSLFTSLRSQVSSPLPELLDVVTSADKVSDDELWDGENASWIGCSQQPGGKCFGGMQRKEWYSPDRGLHCVNKFTDLVKAGLVNESTVPLDICTLDASLNDLCQKLQAALLKVEAANCLASGACTPNAFVYTPGTSTLST